MNYVFIQTSDGESRWINLAHVTRVTWVTDAVTHEEIMVVMFANSDPEVTLKIHGNTDQDRAAIQTIRSRLDAIVGEGGKCQNGCGRKTQVTPGP